MFLRRMTRSFSQKVDETQNLIRREMYADVFQNILKFGAYGLSHSQAVRAEIMRSLLDAGTHVVLYFANRTAKRSPDEQFNFGYGRFKHLSVILPGVCFGISGIFNILSPLASFYTGNITNPDLTMTSQALAAIIASSVGEYYVYYKNLGDIRDDSDLSFAQRTVARVKMSYEIVMNKCKVDPIQSAIVIENVLAMIGVTMPIITSVLCFATGAEWLDLIGEMLSGSVQMYLGYVLCVENFRVLLGKSIDIQDKVQIWNILRSNQSIEQIIAMKATYYSSENIKLFLSLKYSYPMMRATIVQALEQEVNGITDQEDEKEKINDLIVKSTDITLTHLTEILSKLENDITEKFPECKQLGFVNCESNIDPECKRLLDDNEINS